MATASVLPGMTPVVFGQSGVMPSAHMLPNPNPANVTSCNFTHLCHGALINIIYRHSCHIQQPMPVPLDWKDPLEHSKPTTHLSQHCSFQGLIPSLPNSPDPSVLPHPESGSTGMSGVRKCPEVVWVDFTTIPASKMLLPILEG